jgi:hypothetical protein
MLITSLYSHEWRRGALYFIGIFGPLYNTWENDVSYKSRYTLVDYSHRLVTVLRFICVGLVVMSIKPIMTLRDPASAETFCLVLGFLLESLVQLGLELELYFFGEGNWIAIQNHTYRKLLYTHIPFSLTFMAAITVAGYSFFIVSKDSSPAIEDPASTAPYNEGDGHFRVLASSSPLDCPSSGKEGGSDCNQEQGIQWSIGDVPLMLCTSIYVINIVCTLCRKYYTIGKKSTYQEIEQYFVPHNVDYMIHRYGDWIMLLIGESVLSLLIVDTIEAQEYYTVAVLGGVTVIIVQLIIFESEPSHALGHALWRSMFTAALYSILIQVLSIGLIGLGASYKVMLTNILLDQQEAESGHRRLAGASPRISDEVVDALYCGSLSSVLLMLELMLSSHKRVTKSYHQLLKDLRSFNVQSLNWHFLAIAVFKAGLIIYTMTLPAWAQRPLEINLIGFLVVANMAMTRVLGWNYIDMEEKGGGRFKDLQEKGLDGEHFTGSDATEVN